MNKDFWMSKASGESDIAHSNSSRSDLKRSQQWFMEGTESELFPNKKQALEVPNPNSYTALLNSNISSWGNSSNFHSQLFDDESPSISYSGIRKVKVNQVKEPEGFYGKINDESITMGLSFDRGNDSIISMADSFNRGDNNYMSMGEGYNCPSASTDTSNITTMTQSFIKEDDNNNIAMVAFNEHSNTLLMEQVFNKDGNNNTMSKTDNNGLSMRHSFSKNNIISFGGLSDVEASGRLVCNYDFLMGQPSVQRLEEKRGFCESTSDAIVSGLQVDAISRKKDQKGNRKTPANNFPSNVRSLLSTGMLDGIAVKYIAWSREKELRGVIQGAAYLCGCQQCTFSKAINAYEFERHAGCKTKHPNNHIYFDNGKTIYGVVQELRNTPQSVLFDVIQNITGSPINQKSFRLWKESFLAATRELQRIYGKEEGKMVS